MFVLFPVVTGQFLNDNRLLEFRMSKEPEQATGQELRVRAATLWLRVDLRASHRSRARMPGVCVPTLWVFTVNPSLDDSVTRLDAQVRFLNFYALSSLNNNASNILHLCPLRTFLCII